jgi:hypothetical protein
MDGAGAEINIFGSATLLTSCLPAGPTLPSDLPTQFPSVFMARIFWEGKKWTLCLKAKKCENVRASSSLYLWIIRHSCDPGLPGTF